VASADETWAIRGLEAQVARRDAVVFDGHEEERKLARMTKGEGEIASRNKITLPVTGNSRTMNAKQG
jgi:hypothetical protein